MTAAHAPPVFDLSADPAACAVLRTLARRPWDAVGWAALRDRAEELGCDVQAKGHFFGPTYPFVCIPTHPLGYRSHFERAGRRERRRLIASCREMLKIEFGDFEPQEIPF